MPAAIFATFPGGCRSSASTNGHAEPLREQVPTVVLPLPATPMTIAISLAILDHARRRRRTGTGTGAGPPLVTQAER